LRPCDRSPLRGGSFRDRPRRRAHSDWKSAAVRRGPCRWHRAAGLPRACPLRAHLVVIGGHRRDVGHEHDALGLRRGDRSPFGGGSLGAFTAMPDAIGRRCAPGRRRQAEPRRGRQPGVSTTSDSAAMPDAIGRRCAPGRRRQAEPRRAYCSCEGIRSGFGCRMIPRRRQAEPRRAYCSCEGIRSGRQPGVCTTSDSAAE
jgi:hypothetical protein